MKPEDRCSWAVIQPSAVETVAHMNSYFASLAAQNIEAEGQRYFALVMELDGMDGMEQGWLAFPVQPASQVPLPFTYVPVWPCQLGTREPLRPDFDWPFSDCVVSTSDRLIFVPRILNTGRNAHFLSPRDSQRFAQFFRADRDTFILSQIAERKAQMRQEREEDGFSSEYGSMWRDFSARSTRLTIQPGAFFPPLIWISAQLRYDIAADNTGTWKDLEQDRKRIMRLVARFYRLSTERTIRWALTIQNSDRRSFILNHVNQSIPDLTCSALVDFSAQFERPLSPHGFSSPAPIDIPPEVHSFEDSDDGWPEEPRMSEPKWLVPPPIFEVASVRVIYFDVYDTLIDRETGIFAALGPLLNRSLYGFDRHEALSFYFESEMEMKRRTPGSPYAQILADTYGDVTQRLGLTPDNAADALLFAQSVQNWPCMPGAVNVWLLYNLARNRRFSIVAIADVDHKFLLQTPAFASLAPFFEAVFTWDACNTYKPDPAVFNAVLRYYDAHGISRAHSFLVSSSLLRDMEPARELGLPAVWIQHPGTLAANMHTIEDAYPAAAFGSLFHLGTEFLRATSGVN